MVSIRFLFFFFFTTLVSNFEHVSAKQNVTRSKRPNDNLTESISFILFFAKQRGGDPRVHPFQYRTHPELYTRDKKKNAITWHDGSMRRNREKIRQTD